MRRGVGLLPPFLWILAVGLLPPLLAPLPATLEGLLVAALLAAPLAALAAASVAAAPLTDRPAVLLGIAALLALPAIGPVETGWLAALRGGLVLWAAGLLGRAFAAVLVRRWPEPHRLLPAAVGLALCDLFSVAVGPARLAVEGGLLRSLLLPLPVPGGATPGFVGISGLVAIALLRRWLPAAVLSPARLLAAGVVGLWLALGQAYVTRGAAPALPWILGLVTLAAWPRLGITGSILRRTVRLALIAAGLLGLLGALLIATRASATP